MLLTVTEIGRHGYCEELKNEVSFNPIPSKTLLRNFSWGPGIIPSFPVSLSATSGPCLSNRSAGPRFLSLLMNSEMTYAPAHQAPATSPSLLPCLAEGRGHFPYNLLPLPSFKKSSSFKSPSGPIFSGVGLLLGVQIAKAPSLPDAPLH